MDHVWVAEAARRLQASGADVKPREISDLFWSGKLDSSRCPLVGGRRMIPLDYLPTVAEVLRNRRRRVAKQQEVSDVAQ